MLRERTGEEKGRRGGIPSEGEEADKRGRGRLLPCSRLTWEAASCTGREADLGHSCVRIEMS